MNPPKNHSNLSELIKVVVQISISYLQFHWQMYKLKNDIQCYQNSPILEADKYSRSSVDRLNEGLDTFCDVLRNSEEDLKRLGTDQWRLDRGAYAKLVRCRRTLEDTGEARNNCIEQRLQRNY